MVSCLKDRQCLLLLDNAEDVLWKDEEGFHEVLNTMLKFAGGTKVLVTSQRHVGGDLHEAEKVKRLDPLPPGVAAALFCKMAGRELSSEELKSEGFGSLLKQAGGHPLTLRLMARQLVGGMGLAELVERIEKYKARGIEVRGISERDAEHGESLIAALSSAHDYVSENAKTLFGILAMLPAGAMRFTVERIMDDDAAWEYGRQLQEWGLAEIVGARIYLLPAIRLFAESIVSGEIKDTYGPRIVSLMAMYARQFYTHLGASDAKENRFFFAVEEPNLRFATELPCEESEDGGTTALGYLAVYLLSLYLLLQFHDSVFPDKNFLRKDSDKNVHLLLLLRYPA